MNPTPTPITEDTEAQALTWYAVPDGVHRLRRDAGSHFVPRAHVYFERGWQWVAYADNFANRVIADVAASLELAKAAAECAVRELDGEEAR